MEELMAMRNQGQNVHNYGGGGRFTIGGYSKTYNPAYHSAVQPPVQPTQQETMFDSMRGSKMQQIDTIMSGKTYPKNPMTRKQRIATNNYAKRLQPSQPKPSQLFETTPGNKPYQNVKKQQLGKRRWYHKLFGKQAHSEAQDIEMKQKQERILPTTSDNLNVRDTEFQGAGYGERISRVVGLDGVERQVIFKNQSYTPSVHPFDIPPGQDVSWTKNPEGVRMSQLQEPPDEKQYLLSRQGAPYKLQIVGGVVKKVGQPPKEQFLQPLLPDQNKNIMDSSIPAGQQAPIIPKPKPLPRTMKVIDHLKDGTPVLQTLRNSKTIRLDPEVSYDQYDQYDPNLFSSALQTGSIDSDVFYTPPSSLEPVPDTSGDSLLQREMQKQELKNYKQTKDPNILGEEVTPTKQPTRLEDVEIDTSKYPLSHGQRTTKRPLPGQRTNYRPTPKPRTFSGPNYGGKSVSFGDTDVYEYTPEDSLSEPMDTRPPQKGPRPLPRKRSLEEAVTEQPEEPMDTTESSGSIENPPVKRQRLPWSFANLSKKELLVLGGVGAAAMAGSSLLSMFGNDEKKHKYF